MRPRLINIIAFIAIAVIALAMVSCGNSSSGKKKVVAESALSGQPIRITPVSDGIYAISDYTGGTVTFINSSTIVPMHTIYVPGKSLGVAIGVNTVYVGNEVGGNVNAFSMDSKYRYTLGPGFGDITTPSDIATDLSAGLVFVVDGYTAKVKVYELDGTFVRQFPGFVMSDTDLANPTGIALDKVNELVYVSDFGGIKKVGMAMGGAAAARVQVYSYTGSYQRTIDNTQAGYEFSAPQGLYLTTGGDLYMADVIMGQVLIFNSSDLGIGTLGSHGTGAGELFIPMDVVVDEATGDVLVTDYRRGLVEAFRGAAQ